MVYESQNHVAIEQQPLALAGMGHIGKLMWTDIQLVCQNLPVTGGLVEHDNEVRIFKNILDFTRRKQVFHVLRNSGRDTAPFAEPLPDFYGVGGRLFLLQKKVELVHIVAGGFALAAVFGHTPPNLILDNEHPDLFQLLAQFFNVVADKPVFDVHIRPVIEQVQRAFDVDFQRRCHMVGFLFVLRQQGIVQIFQQRHILRHRVFKVGLINLVNAAVDHCFLHRLQPFFATHDQLTEGQDEISLQSNRIILLAVIAVDVHRVDILAAGRADFDDLPAHARHKGCVLAFGIADNDIVISGKEGIGDLPLCRKALAGTRRTENQAVGRFQLFPIHHDQVVGERVQAIVQRLRAVLEQLLCSERDEDGGGAGGQRALNLDQVLCQRQTAHESLFLLEIQPAQIAVVFLRNAGCLERIGFQLLQCLAGIHHQEGNQEHPLILVLQFFQQRFGVLAVGSQVGGDDVDVIPRTDRFFLFLDLAAIQLGDGALDGLNGLVLVYGLDVHGHDLAGFHIQEVFQQLVAEIGRRDGKETHGTVQRSHLERFAAREGKAAGGDKILHRQPGGGQPFPVKIELVVVAHVEHGVHQVQPLLAVQCPGHNAQTAEVVEQVGLHVFQPGLCLFHRLCLDAESQVLGFGQAIVAALQLLAQHLAVLLPDIVKTILPGFDLNPALKALHIRGHIHEGQFKVDGAVEEIQKAAPLLKDGSPVLLLGQLIVDVLELDGFCVIVVADPADAIREHPLKRDRLLRRAGNAIIPLCLFKDGANLLFLPLGQGVRQHDFAGGGLLFSAFPSKQYAVPPVLPMPAASKPHSSCWSDRAGLWDE